MGSYTPYRLRAITLLSDWRDLREALAAGYSSDFERVLFGACLDNKLDASAYGLIAQPYAADTRALLIARLPLPSQMIVEQADRQIRSQWLLQRALLVSPNVTAERAYKRWLAEFDTGLELLGECVLYATLEPLIDALDPGQGVPLTSTWWSYPTKLDAALQKTEMALAGFDQGLIEVRDSQMAREPINPLQARTRLIRTSTGPV